MEHWYLTLKQHEARQRELILEAKRERLARIALGHRMAALQPAGTALLRFSLVAMVTLLIQAA